MSIKEKIGMYSTDEILEFMTEGEGRGFLGRSMFDAMYFEIERLNNIINELEKILINNKLYGEDVYKKSKLTKEQFKKEYPYTLGSYQNSTYLLLKLQELKGSESNE